MIDTITKLHFPLIKSNIKGLKNQAGRNNLGKITSFNKGGGHKQNYRVIDFIRYSSSVEIVLSLEYDPNRTSYIAAVYSLSKKKFSYVLAPKGLFPGDILKSNYTASLNLGHSMPFSKIPLGTFICNISYSKGKPGRMSRAAGAFSQLVEKNLKYCEIIFKNGKRKKLSINAYAMLGMVSSCVSEAKIKKAGRSRWLNKRPKVRGVAMNPIDHPHGGGEGKTSGGRASVTPWGKPTKNGSKKAR